MRNNPVKDFFGCGIVATLFMALFFAVVIEPNHHDWVMSGLWNEMNNNWYYREVITGFYFFVWFSIFIFVRKAKAKKARELNQLAGQ